MSSVKIPEYGIDFTGKSLPIKEIIDNPDAVKDIVNRYIQFNNGGSFISTCFNIKVVHLRDVFTTFDSIFNSVFSVMADNSTKIRNYRIVNSFLLSLIYGLIHNLLSLTY